MQIRSAHSRMSLADIVSRPVAFDLFSLFKSEKKSWKHWSVLVMYLWKKSPSGESILRASSGPIVAKWILNSFESSVGLVIDTPFTFRDVTAVFPDLRESTFVDSLPGLPWIACILVKAVLIISMLGYSNFGIYNITFFFFKLRPIIGIRRLTWFNFKTGAQKYLDHAFVSLAQT